jgi:hypothetical protein
MGSFSGRCEMYKLIVGKFEPKLYLIHLDVEGTIIINGGGKT